MQVLSLFFCTEGAEFMANKLLFGFPVLHGLEVLSLQRSQAFLRLGCVRCWLNLVQSWRQWRLSQDGPCECGTGSMDRPHPRGLLSHQVHVQMHRVQ